MMRQMKETETKYVQINNRNNQINLSSIISRFSKVRRFLTPAEMRVCLKKGALLYSVNGDELTPLTESNYNLIEDEPVVEEVKEETVTTPVEETPVVEEPKKEEKVETTTPVEDEIEEDEPESLATPTDETIPDDVEEETVEIK